MTDQRVADTGPVEDEDDPTWVPPRLNADTRFGDDDPYADDIAMASLEYAMDERTTAKQRLS